MGDSGTMFLGFVLVWFSVGLSQAPKAVATPVTFLWILALPLWDAFRVIIHRLYHQRSPFKPDRYHLHHLLMEKGFSAVQITLVMAALTLILGIIGILGNIWHVTEWLMFLNFWLGFLIYCGIIYLPVTEPRPQHTQ